MREEISFNFYLASLFVIGLNAQQIKWASQYVASAVCLQCGPLSDQSSLSLQITPTRVGWGHRPTLLGMNVFSKTNMAILTIWRKIRLISGFSPFSIFQPTADRIPQRPRFQPWRSQIQDNEDDDSFQNPFTGLESYAHFQEWMKKNEFWHRTT